MLRWAEAALKLLAAMPEGALVYVFSHGQFIEAVRSLVVNAGMSDREDVKVLA